MIERSESSGAGPDVEPTQVSFGGRGVRLVADRWDPRSPDGARKGIAVLLHGGGQRRHSWHATGRRLARQGWTAVALDARGHGDSDWAPDGDYSLDALVGDLAAVVETLDEPPVLIGASMGGMTSLVGEGERGGLARALVLVDIVPKVEPEGVQRIVDFMSGAPYGFGSLEEVADAITAYNPHRKRPPSLEGLRRTVRQGVDGRWRWHWDPALLTDGESSREEWQRRARAAAIRVSVPTLLVRGGHSDIVSPEGAAELLELIPGAQHVDVAAAGHMVAGDDNDIFTRHVGEFLDTTVRTAP